MKLKGKISLMVLVPALTTGIVAIIISGSLVKSNLEEQVKEQLKVAAYAGTSSYENMLEKLALSGADDTLQDEMDAIVDTIYTNAGIHASIFDGSTRVATTILDTTGNRAVGSTAASDVVTNVINNGQDYYSRNIIVSGKDYYAYYVPIVLDGSTQVTGIFAAVSPQSEVNSAFYDLLWKIIVGVIIVVGISVVAANYIVNRLTGAMTRNVESLKKLSDGYLDFEENEIDARRKDEIGELVSATTHVKNTLKLIIKEVNDSASSLLAASEELEQVSGQTSITTQGIEQAVEEIASGAMSQAQSTEDASKQTLIMGEDIEKTSHAVEQLSVNAGKMKETGTTAMNTLGDLNHINEKTKNEIEAIYEQTNNTNNFAKKIKEAANIITAIAEETNLLSLNASIEAARAGESGRGFAVVAEQIKKLAEQSSKSAKEIGIVIETLIQNSDKAVDIMHEVKNTINIQNEKIGLTKDNFEVVYEGINQSSEQIKKISNITKELNNVRIVVVDIIGNLSAISEENAASTEETSASTAQLTEAVKDIGGEVSTLRKLSDELVKAISIFKI